MLSTGREGTARATGDPRSGNQSSRPRLVCHAQRPACACHAQTPLVRHPQRRRGKFGRRPEDHEEAPTYLAAPVQTRKGVERMATSSETSTESVDLPTNEPLTLCEA